MTADRDAGVTAGGENGRAISPAPTAEEAVAIVASIERFMRATALPAPEPVQAPDGWRRAAILEGVSREQEDDAPAPWINT
jgi:hypothetical protein